MSDTTPQGTFSFSRPFNTSDQHSIVTVDTNLTGSDVHPIELVVQGIIGPSLDVLSGKLMQLQESQLILVSRLKILEKKLNNYDQNISVVDANSLISRINSLRRRLARIVAVLKVVETRVQTTLDTVEGM